MNLYFPVGFFFLKGDKKLSILQYLCLTPNTALEILDNAEELELICIQLEEEKENTVPQKRQRKKSQLAMESDEMDFIDLTPSNPKKSKLSCDEQQRQEVQQQQNQQQESEMNQQEWEQPEHQRKEEQQKQKQPQQQQSKEQQKQQQPHQHRNKRPQEQQEIQRTKTTARGTKEKPSKISKKADLKEKKSAEIEAGKALAAAFFKEHLANSSQSLPLPSQDVPLKSLPLERTSASQLLLSHDTTLQGLPSQDKVHLQNPHRLESSPLLKPRSPCSVSHSPIVSRPLPSLCKATLGETGSLIRSSLNDIDDFSDGMDSAQNPTLDESGYFSPEEEEEPEKEIKKPDGVEPETQTVPCDNCSDIVKALKAEIISLKKRQLPGKWIIKNEINSLVKSHLYP